jgi:hypothetical protein
MDYVACREILPSISWIDVALEELVRVLLAYLNISPVEIVQSVGMCAQIFFPALQIKLADLFKG